MNGKLDRSNATVNDPYTYSYTFKSSVCATYNHHQMQQMFITVNWVKIIAVTTL